MTSLQLFITALWRRASKPLIWDRATSFLADPTAPCNRRHGRDVGRSSLSTAVQRQRRYWVENHRALEPCRLASLQFIAFRVHEKHQCNCDDTMLTSKRCRVRTDRQTDRQTLYPGSASTMCNYKVQTRKSSILTTYSACAQSIIKMTKWRRLYGDKVRSLRHSFLRLVKFSPRQYALAPTWSNVVSRICNKPTWSQRRGDSQHSDDNGKRCWILRRTDVIVYWWLWRIASP